PYPTQFYPLSLHDALPISLILCTLMETIDKVGIERGKQLDTRGGLLQEYVAQLIEREQARSKWRRGAPAANDVVQLLSRIACARSEEHTSELQSRFDLVCR